MVDLGVNGIDANIESSIRRTITYTTAIVALFLYFEIVSDVDLDNITAEDNFVVGRKLGILNILAETSMQTTLWGNKCCILLLYHRLTLQLSLNLSTDLILLIIPVVLISRLNMKIGKKILLVCLFSLGIFVMLAAILTKVSVFTNQTAPIWFLWCVREVSTAMLVGNLPLCMPTFRMWWRFFFPGSGASATPGPHESASGASAVTKRSVATTAAFSEATGGGGESSTWGSSPARSRMNDDIEMYGMSKGGARGEGRRLSIDEESV
ncbi:hypothetical protein K4K56_008513 [Colletotrichum sp. SAR 10_98]|nr:hypothetical protein K4K55_008460 [Colletotrichum sp. SAR 10_96]KAI8253949.1 hypothetical protein K4K56_008513 [Colletotrichum sp. SAR 10_98]